MVYHCQHYMPSEVAITRARQMVFITGYGDPTKLLELFSN